MKHYLVAALVASTLIGCAAKEDGLGQQLAKFRAARNIYDRAYVRCIELVNTKYHQQLYGEGHLEGRARLEAVNATRFDYALCKKGFNDKAQALWEEQSPEVHAFYKAKRPAIHKDIEQINREATQWLKGSAAKK